MNVLLSLRGGKRLLLGVPFEKEWTLHATPAENGHCLKLIVDGTEIDLLHGKPVSLDHAIEMKAYAETYEEIVGAAEYLETKQPREDIFYFETSRFLKDIEAILQDGSHCPEGANVEMMKRESFDESSVAFKWSNILQHMNDRLGAVTVSAWFDQATVKEFTWNNLIIDAGSDFRCEIIQRRCLEYIRDALAELYGCSANVSVVSTKKAVE